MKNQFSELAAHNAVIMKWWSIHLASKITKIRICKRTSVKTFDIMIGSSKVKEKPPFTNLITAGDLWVYCPWVSYFWPIFFIKSRYTRSQGFVISK